ncbi:MAG: hypothetical protein WKG07_49745 [Hymenobacter sp.]
MRHVGLAFEAEVHLPLYYREESVGSRRADFSGGGSRSGRAKSHD